MARPGYAGPRQGTARQGWHGDGWARRCPSGRGWQGWSRHVPVRHSNRIARSSIEPMKKKPIRIVAPATSEIPARFSREIGRIIVRWAYLEHIIRRLGWDILGVDQKIGRIAVRDPRVDDYLDMIADIASLKNIKIDTSNLSSLKSRANEVLRWRDLLGHGIWIQTPDGWLLQMISGNYPKNYKAEYRKRRINPEGLNVDIEGLRSVSNGVEILIGEVSSIRKALREQLGS